MLSVNHLAMLAKTACSLSGVLDWVDQSLADVEEHLKVIFFSCYSKVRCPQVLDLVLRHLDCCCIVISHGIGYLWSWSW